MEVVWSASTSASAFRMLEIADPLPKGTDPAIIAETGDVQNGLSLFATSIFVSRADLLLQVIPLSTRIANHRELAQAALNKLVGREKGQAHALELARILTAAKSVYTRTKPDAESELARSVERHRAAWADHGAKIPRRIGSLLGSDILAERVNVVVIDGGGRGGIAYTANNLVCWETDTDDPSQLAWYLSQLHLDLPRFREKLRPKSAEWICALAMIPAILACANEKGPEIAISREEIAAVVRSWLPGDKEFDLVAGKLELWWETYLARRPSWETALMGLEHFLLPSEPA